MQNTASLNCLYAEYKAGKIEKKEFEGIIFSTIRNNFICPPGFIKQDREDFVSWLYPRISRAVDNYRDIGASFDAYINKMTWMAAGEYRSRRLRNYNTEIAAWLTHVPEAYACEMEVGYGDDFDDPVLRAKKAEGVKTPRQFLILVLKCCRYVSEDFLERVSPQLGMDPGVLREMVNRLKEFRLKREASLIETRELANRQLCRCLFYQKTIRSMAGDLEAVSKTKDKLQHCRDRLEKTRKRLSGLHLDPSNAQIAKLLGIKKSTVDSVLYTLKLRWHNVPKDKIILN